MIGRLSGKLIARHPPQVIVDVHGIGYEIDVPMSTFYQLPVVGSDVTLFTHLLVREDAHLLYGFASEQERHDVSPAPEDFRRRRAHRAVGSLRHEHQRSMVRRGRRAGQRARFIKVPGIGKKTAERLLLELKDKLDVTVVAATAAGAHSGDILNALSALGYNDKEAAWAVKQLPAGAPVAEGIRQALKLLSKSFAESLTQ